MEPMTDEERRRLSDIEATVTKHLIRVLDELDAPPALKAGACLRIAAAMAMDIHARTARESTHRALDQVFDGIAAQVGGRH